MNRLPQTLQHFQIWYDAIQKPDILRMRQFVHEGWDVNAYFPPEINQAKGLNALLLVVAREVGRLRLHHWALVEFLLQAGADPNCHPNLDYNEATTYERLMVRETAVQSAFRYAHAPPKIMDLFYTYGADKGPIGHASTFKMLEVFLRHGVDLSNQQVLWVSAPPKHLLRQMRLLDAYNVDFDSLLKDKTEGYLYQLYKKANSARSHKEWKAANQAFVFFLRRSFKMEFNQGWFSSRIKAYNTLVNIIKYVRFCVWIASQTMYISFDIVKDMTDTIFATLYFGQI